MSVYVIPNYVSAEINQRLDAAIADCPDAAKDRDVLYEQLIAHVVEHGVIPEFSLAKIGDPA